MCGIVGYVGGRPCLDLLVAGLEKLEYRGYDSAGISIQHEGQLESVRAVGNLSALRELALLWVADRVEESLHGYLDAHGISDAWETRERVVVGISGRPGGDNLIRRQRVDYDATVGGKLSQFDVTTDYTAFGKTVKADSPADGDTFDGLVALKRAARAQQEAQQSQQAPQG